MEPTHKESSGEHFEPVRKMEDPTSVSCVVAGRPYLRESSIVHVRALQKPARVQHEELSNHLQMGFTGGHS